VEVEASSSLEEEGEEGLHQVEEVVVVVVRLQGEEVVAVAVVALEEVGVQY
jgi:hypothetical protein